MGKKKFNVQEWLSSPEPHNIKEPIRATTHHNTDKHSEVIQLIEQIELQHTDLTSTYEEWRNIGFALTDEFGENGLDLYHRISQFHPEYDHKECDKQFDQCQKSKGSGVNISTLFYLAKNAGIELPRSTPPIRHNISSNQKQPSKEQRKLPTLPEAIFEQLPDFLKQIVEVAESNEERDLLLLGSITTLSCAFPSIYGIYHNKKVFANLFLFVSAQASAGKGRLNHCRKLVKPIHDNLKEQSKIARQQYELDLAEYNANKKKQADLEKPAEPPIQLLFIPANSSASGAFQLLNDNQGKGLIFETEGDTLANTFKSDFGNYSDGFRKSFHHETINYYRKTDREYVDLESPCLSTVLSGTPKQVLNLIPSAEDGLFSRFMFYYMNMQPVWSNVFASNTPTGLDDYFHELGKAFFGFYETLQAAPDIQFLLTKDQQQSFNQFFNTCFQRYFNLKGEEYIGTIRRLGLITFRISMILSALRLMDSGELPDKLICEEQDFNTALGMAETLIEHAGFIFNQLPETDQVVKKPNKRERFYEALPPQFNRQGYLKIATQLGIKDKTAQGYITNFVKGGLLHRDEKDSYTKEVEDFKDTKD
ncbi:MAG: DUF3987 domain-containing protein [Desulfovibrionales bacterium]|nr:DUF3987 domain-containing protein [Desulfovibrionales bacterium]